MWDESSVLVNAPGGSRLLSESSLGSPEVSQNADLSLSELSIDPTPKPKAARTRRPPKFSLLAPRDDTEVYDEDNEEDPDPDENDAEGTGRAGQEEAAEQQGAARQVPSRTREEKLQHDLVVLQKLNTTLAAYNEVLKEAKSQTDMVSEQLTVTNALLDKYMRLMSRSEKITNILLDEDFHGADADEETLERERKEEEERLRREEERRLIDERRERERQELEERERLAKVEAEQARREREEKARGRGRGSGVRGVRGTRASIRAAAARTTFTRGGTIFSF
ncbi:hypothetical protein PUNSTDRAFT_131842 [Punctularia strigosozonata HHB-11173 SS5]|uniref:uncharacterized protein n=1 Tax=Punctularia strigosozonata (strain HHB-11173) TaxID=741275 RepID=UPI0004417923|nr:uncharacterized protein PUNSTDRAFT_131842 [Punctularia strigosozonata HHB-11173 SS5]EIN11686.1 hypothetical protein PUNSTDRAFT_131842 [Punctularia strigosozonata HHB-11173 SS5]